MDVHGTGFRTIWWDGGTVAVIDQRLLPHRFVVDHWTTLDAAAVGIEDMEVRGAPLIGVAAVHGMALAMADDPSDVALHDGADRLLSTRPTAVNLRWAVERATHELGKLEPGERATRARALANEMADDDVATCRAIGRHGEPLLPDTPDRSVQVLTHCNAGWLACVDWGTATSTIYLAHEAGRAIHVWVSETRPRNQGSSLTAFELGAHGVDHTVIVDNAAGHLLRHGMVDICIVGADRVAANGDVANKIGTYLKALACHDTAVPFYVAAPCSTIDTRCPTGDEIPIEERSADEVTTLAGIRIAPEGSPARNWGFDVTPARLITGIITERGVVAATAEGIASLHLP